MYIIGKQRFQSEYDKWLQFREGVKLNSTSPSYFKKVLKRNKTFISAYVLMEFYMYGELA